MVCRDAVEWGLSEPAYYVDVIQIQLSKLCHLYCQICKLIQSKASLSGHPQGNRRWPLKCVLALKLSCSSMNKPNNICRSQSVLYISISCNAFYPVFADCHLLVNCLSRDSSCARLVHRPQHNKVLLVATVILSFNGVVV